MSTPSWIGERRASGSGTHVEADDHRAGRRGEHHVGVGDAADAGVQDVAARPRVVRELGDLVLDRLERAGHVGLQDQVELHGLTLLHPLEHVLEADRNAHAACQRLGLQPVRALVGEMARLAVALDHAHRLARVGHAVEAEHLDRLAGSRLLDAAGPGSRASRARGPSGRRPRARRRSAACRAGPATVTTGPRPGSSRDSITVPLAGASWFAFSSSTSATSRIMSSRLSRPSLVFADTSQKIVSPPQSSGVRPCAGQLAAHALRLRALLVDLVDGDHHRHAGGLGVVDRLGRLRHHAVVGRDHDHRDVGHLARRGRAWR